MKRYLPERTCRWCGEDFWPRMGRGYNRYTCVCNICLHNFVADLPHIIEGQIDAVSRKLKERTGYPLYVHERVDMRLRLSRKLEF